MKKPKIEVGQCYEKNDIIYEIKCRSLNPLIVYWMCQNTITKTLTEFTPEELQKMRRPFQNFG